MANEVDCQVQPLAGTVGQAGEFPVLFFNLYEAAVEVRDNKMSPLLYEQLVETRGGSKH